MLITKNLTLIKKGRQILSDVSIELPLGSITLLLGKSGAGKSTLLRCLAGLERGYEGKIFCQQEDLLQLSAAKRAEKLSYIMQSYALFSHLCVLDNCAQPLQVVYNIEPKLARTRALDMLRAFGMDSFAAVYPKTLSGGQKQRVAIARAMVLGSSMLLLDEPTSALDRENSRLLAELVLDLQSRGKGIVIATHDEAFAQMVAGRAYSVESGVVTQTR